MKIVPTKLAFTLFLFISNAGVEGGVNRDRRAQRSPKSKKTSTESTKSSSKGTNPSTTKGTIPAIDFEAKVKINPHLNIESTTITSTTTFFPPGGNEKAEPTFSPTPKPTPRPTSEPTPFMSTPAPFNFEPTTTSPTSASSLTVRASPYALFYTLEDDQTVPSQRDLASVAEVTRGYLEEFMAEFYSMTSLTNLDDFLTVLIRNSFSVGQPVQIDYRSTGLFNPSTIFLPGQRQLDELIASAFMGEELEIYISLLRRSLPDGNVFSTTTAVVQGVPTFPTPPRPELGEGNSTEVTEVPTTEVPVPTVVPFPTESPTPEVYTTEVVNATETPTTELPSDSPATEVPTTDSPKMIEGYDTFPPDFEEEHGGRKQLRLRRALH